MNVIFFDGVCGLCNGFVDFIMKVDKAGKFKFSPLQSEYAQKNLPSAYTADLDSVVAVINGKNYRKSEAVMQIFRELGGVWKVISFLGILPEGVRNCAYDLVASSRYKLFGKKETCRLPTPEERARFIL